MTSEQEAQWAEAEVKRQRSTVMLAEAKAEIAADPTQRWINNKHALGHKMKNNADRVQDSITGIVQLS